jgi:mycothiol maleylpyruvate isomerase-like protein
VADTGRDEAVATLGEGHDRVDQLLAGVSEADVIREATIGGGDWSAKDLVGHIATWEEAAIQAIVDVRRGTVPRIETYLREAGGVDRYNAEKVPELGALSLDVVLDRAAAAHETLASQICGMSDEEWFASVPYPAERRRTLANLLGSITGASKRPFGHAFAHLPDLEAFVRTLG